MTKFVFLKDVAATRLITTVSFTVIAALSPAQWSTSYTNPKVLATEVGTAPIDVMTLEDGSVVAAYSVKSNDKYKVMIPRFAANGTQMQPGTGLGEVDRPYHLDLIPSPFDDGGFNMSTVQPRQTLSGNVPLHKAGFLHQIREDGTWQASTNLFTGAYIAVSEDGNSYFYYNHDDDTLRLSGSFDEVDLNNTIPSEAHTVQTSQNPRYALACYTRSSRIPGIPTEVWIMATHAAVAPSTDQISHFQIHSQQGVTQFQPRLTEFDAETYMVTWLGEKGGLTSMYSALLTKTGQTTGSVFIIQDNIESSSACPSPLGVPVHAYVQRDHNANPPADTLWAGLIDPRNGISLNLPMATGTGMEVKTLRQEDNGDFSLVYSVVENNTTLLKTRRISGTSAMTLWETTVADLGMASSEFIRRYPNTAVAGFNNALYFVTRKDNPYTRKVTYHLARLRSDGQLGAD